MSTLPFLNLFAGNQKDLSRLFCLTRISHRHHQGWFLWRRPNARCYSTQVSGGFSDEDDPIKLMDGLERYSRFQPCPVSIAHFLEFGRSASLESSFMFLRREVPVRIANVMKELQLMPSELRATRGCQLVTSQYAQSFKEMVAFEPLSGKDPQVLNDFTSALMTVRERHADTVIAMAEAVMEVKINEKHRRLIYGTYLRPKFEKNIQYFLDRLYTSRISTRMLINQHTLLFDDPDKHSKDPRQVDGQGLSMVGTIDPYCDVTPVVQQAFESARFLCEQYYLSAPEMIYTALDATKREKGEIPQEGRDDVVSFVYVPSHLYHILFELFKNAMRATIEYAGDDASTFEPIRVVVVKGKEDVTIKISDRGGGIPRSLRSHIFEYLYTTAPNPILTDSAEFSDVSNMIQGGGQTQGAPLAGLGYGLPLSRLYARYFAGDLELYSTEGWGTDAVIFLHALAGEAKERLPIYHEAGSKKIYEAQLTASDWTLSKSDYDNTDAKETGHNKDL